MENKPQRAIKIKSEKLENFAGFSNIEVHFEGNVIYLIGVNESGKTTLGFTAIVAGIKGISAKSSDRGVLIGERKYFIGDKKKSANDELILIDEAFQINGEPAQIKIINHITEKSNDILFVAPDGYPWTKEEWLKDLFNMSLLSEKYFCRLSSIDQAISLGIDTQEYDEKLKNIKTEFTFINRDIKSRGELVEPEKTERVNISELLKEKKEADEYNEKEKVRLNEYNIIVEENEQIKAKIKELELSLQENENIIRKYQPSLIQETSHIENKIANAEIINEKAHIYEDYLEKKKQQDKDLAKLEENKAKQEKVKQDRLEFIQKFKLPSEKFIISEEGELLFMTKEGTAVPIKEPYLSKGKRERITTALNIWKNPACKWRFIEDWNLIDEDKQIIILNELLAAGYQVLIEEVGKEKKEGENTILLKNFGIVESY